MFAYASNYAAAAQEAVGAALSVANVVLASSERLSTLNFRLAREGVDGAFGSVKSLLEADDFSGTDVFQASLARPMLQQVIAYADDVGEIAFDAQQEIRDLLIVEYEKFARNMASSSEAMRPAARQPGNIDVAGAEITSPEVPVTVARKTRKAA